MLRRAVIRITAWSLGAPLVGVLLALPSAGAAPSPGEPPQVNPASATATPECRNALEEQAQKLGAEADKLRQDGQLAPAITAWEKKLTLDRELASERAISGDLVQLAKLHLYNQDLVRARSSGQEALALLVKLHGEQHYLVVQARQFLSDVERITRFTPEERAREQEMLRLQDQAIKIYKLGRS